MAYTGSFVQETQKTPRQGQNSCLRNCRNKAWTTGKNCFLLGIDIKETGWLLSPPKPIWQTKRLSESMERDGIIEVFFKMAKHHLNLEKEIEVRDYSGMIGHITITMVRYIFSGP